MPLYRFRARDARGAPRSGVREAASPSALADDLRGQGWLPLEVSAQAGGGAGLNLSPSAWLSPRSLDVEISLQQIASMLRGGLTLLSALQTVVRQARRRSMALVWEQVAEDIQEGLGLADAMAKHKCFGKLATQLARVGEQTGALDKTLERAARTMESRRLLKGQLLTALAYPAVVFAAAIGVTVFMMVYLVPKLERFLLSLGKKLPPTTRLLVDFSHVATTYWPHALIVLIAAGGSLAAAYSWPPGRRFFDAAALRVPAIGHVLRLSITTSFARSLGILVGSGITVTEGLRTVEGLFRNRAASGATARARQSVLNGGNLSAPLAEPGVFMPMLSSMVEVGESTGALEEALGEVAAFHEQQLQSAIKRLSIAVEPIIVLVVGGIVGFVYIAFFQALYAGAGAAS